MKNLENLTNKTLAKRFQWKDKKENLYYIDEMETRHLFYTLRMIWNHTMPAIAKLHPYTKYTFSSYYTKDYMIEAIRNIIPELAKRELPAQYLKDIGRMINYLTILQLDGKTFKL